MGVELLMNLPMTDAALLAQTVSDPNVLGQIQAAFQNFIQSGQVWAMLIGIVLGFAIRSITA